MNDTKVWLEDEKGNRFAIIKTEKVDMQKQLTEQISRLLEENKQLKVKNSKYKRAFEILKDVVIISNLDGTYLLSVWGNKLMPEPVCYLEKEQGELLEELMNCGTKDN